MQESNSILFAFAGPGGTGKSTICEEIAQRDKRARLSVSSTSRNRRADEIEGVDYHFLTKEEFEKRISSGKLTEYTFFNNNYYGTEKQVIENAIADRADLILDIEVEGIGNLKRIYGDRIVTVFVFTPSWDELMLRLKKSGNRTEEEIQKRLEIAKHEVQALTADGFSDYLLINDKFEESVKAAQEIINTERRRFKRVKHTIVL